MTPTQIYELANKLNHAAFGDQAQLEVADLQGLIALGDYVMNAGSTEVFLNTLMLRVYKTIFSYRAYYNKLDLLVLGDEEYGAVVQKISMKLPELQSDPTYSLVDGQSIDHYVVNKPDVVQKLFYTLTPYMLPMTTQRKALKEAFLSAEAMESFLSLVYGRVQTILEKTLEDLARATISNFMAEISDTTQHVKLLTMYNNDTGASLTPATALRTADFLRYCIGKIKLYSKKMTDLTTMFNQGDIERHTPYEFQNIYMSADFITQSETISEYAAFHREFVSLDGYRDMTFWQNSTAGNETSINVNRASDGTAVEINNIIGFIHDRDALGIYKRSEDVVSTPVNAFALYYNTVWHERQMWFNDVSENAVMFTVS